jgi:iron-sulfur cluster repair protein YtfE (RIC family)
MDQIKPIKRHLSLQPLSRDHHDALMLCFKIRTGIKKQIEPERILNYARWMIENHLEPHFKIEEEFVFPVLDSGHELIIEVLSQHAALRQAFTTNAVSYNDLNALADLLDSHVRFEERVLFNVIQEAASPAQLLVIEHAHNKGVSCDDWDDRFWL